MRYVVKLSVSAALFLICASGVFFKVSAPRAIDSLLHSDFRCTVISDPLTHNIGRLGHDK